MKESSGDRAWVATNAEIGERREHARRLVGLSLRGARYLTLDFRRWDLVPDFRGLRVIEDAAEWAEPTWEFAACDSVEFGVELTTTDDRTFSVTWDPLGDRESIGLREGPLLDRRFDSELNLAVWDVAGRSRWRHFLERPVQDVALHYLPWGEEGFWCPRITLSFGTEVIELLLGSGDGDGVQPAADQVAVLFNPPELPSWEQSAQQQ